MDKDARLYAKFTLDFPYNPKILPLSDAAFRCLVEATIWSREQQTDGFLARRLALARWSLENLRELCANDDDHPSLLESDNGWYIHDFAEHQDTKQDIRERRERAKRAGQIGGLARAKQVAKRTAKQKPSKLLSKTQAETETETEPPLIASDEAISGGPRAPTNGATADTPTPPDPNDPPDQFCRKHMPNGTDDNCGACMSARKANDAYWLKQSLDERKAEQQRRRDETNTRLNAIPNCRLCDDDGYRHPDHLQVCDHIDRADTAAAGMAKVRAALNNTNAEDTPF